MKFGAARPLKENTLEALVQQLNESSSDSISTLLLHELMDSLDEFLIIFDPHLQVIGANRCATIFFGYSAEELNTKTLPSLLEARGRRRMLKIAGDTLEKRVDTAVFLTRSRKKRLVRFSLSPLRGKDKTIKGYLLVGRKQKEDYGERFVDASNGLTERMLESFASPLFIIDGPTRFVRDCNGIATDVFGFAREEFIGRRLLDHISDQERKQNEALLEKADKTYATAGVFQSASSSLEKTCRPCSAIASACRS